MHKMAVAKAQAQRQAAAQAAMVDNAPPAVPKTRLGRFGAKFAGAVLSPVGESHSTMV